MVYVFFSSAKLTSKTFPQSKRAPCSILEQWASAVPCCRPQQLWLVPRTPLNVLPRMGSGKHKGTTHTIQEGALS